MKARRGEPPQDRSKNNNANQNKKTTEQPKMNFLSRLKEVEDGLQTSTTKAIQTLIAAGIFDTTVPEPDEMDKDMGIIPRSELDQIKSRLEANPDIEWRIELIHSHEGELPQEMVEEIKKWEEEHEKMSKRIAPGSGKNKASNKSKKAEKREMPDMSGWIPFSFTNDEPTAWAGWKDGVPFTRQLRKNGDGDTTINEKKITLKELGSQHLKDEITRCQTEGGKDLILFRGESFSKPEFVAEMVYPANVNVFTEALNAIPLTQEIYREPKLYTENGHIVFPIKYYARRDDSYQLILKDALNIGATDTELYDEGMNLLRKYPKQLTLYYSVIGANVVNYLGVNDFPITIDAVGAANSGKSLGIVLALKFGYGIGEAILQDDAMNSPFRHHAISNSTNLPIYTEEAKISAANLSKLKSRAKNLRGNADKSMKTYDAITTWVLSRNTDLLSEELDPVEKRAQDKRIYKYRFDKEDVVPEALFNVGKKFMDKIKDQPGGLLYDKLKEKSVSEIRDKYYSLMENESDGREVVALLGAWLFDDAKFEPSVSKNIGSTVKEEFIDKIVSAYRRIERMKDLYKGGYKEDDFRSTFEDRQLNNELIIDWEKWEFKITGSAFNLLKKQLGITLSARKFAEAHGFEYGVFSIYGDRSKIIKGTIPDEYKEKPITKKDDATKNLIDDYETDESNDHEAEESKDHETDESDDKAEESEDPRAEENYELGRRGKSKRDTERQSELDELLK